MRFDAYDRDRLRPTVVHIGPGVFHRAHQAVYADDLLCAGHADGAIWAIAPRSRAVRAALAGQRYVYHVIEQTAPPVADGTPVADTGRLGVRIRPIGSVLGIDVAADDVEAALARMTDPAVTVVTLTVTEHGYGTVMPGGPLDGSRAEVVHDLAHPTDPVSVPGLIVEALARRRAAGVDPFTVASCDNLPDNGGSTRRAVVELAEQRDARLAAWVAGNVAFPSSMVDRMVPATTDADRARLADAGIDDAWPVVTEGFRQWVLEDRFPFGRPRWEDAGVELVSNVTLHEQVKLRVLNAAHSAIAYWGLLAGHDSIAAATADPRLAAAARSMLDDEVLPTLTAPPGWSLAGYARSTLARFADPALPYTTRKVAGDGSQKLVARLMPTVRAALAAGIEPLWCVRVLAAWVTCLAGPRAERFGVADPALAAEITRLRSDSGPGAPDSAVAALVGRPGLLDASDPRNGALLAAVAAEARELWALAPDEASTHVARPVTTRLLRVLERREGSS